MHGRRRCRALKFVKGPVKAYATRSRKENGKYIWMMGGAEIIASFLDEKEIDEFMTPARELSPILMNPFERTTDA